MTADPIVVLSLGTKSIERCNKDSWLPQADHKQATSEKQAPKQHLQCTQAYHAFDVLR